MCIDVWNACICMYVHQAVTEAEAAPTAGYTEEKEEPVHDMDTS